MAKTNSKVIEAIDNVINTGIRIRFWYGDDETGCSWVEENDTIGTIGRSTGDYKIPLLIKNKRSLGGGAILTHCIVKLVDISNNKVLYVHPKFSLPEIDCYFMKVIVDHKVYANCDSWNQAIRLTKFLTGQRNCK